MKRKAALFLALALTVTTLSACGGNSGSNTTDTNTVDSAGTTDAADTDASGESDAAGGDTAATDTSAVDPSNWGEFDSLIKEIKSTTDYEEREALMHQAEDILMETGALLPLYYYNDIYLQKSNVSNI